MMRDESWREDAQCNGVDTEIFFPPRDKDKYRVIAAQAKLHCFGSNGQGECPVRLQCLMYAVETDEVHGIWGGMSHRERNALVRKWKRIGKPGGSLLGYLEESSKKK
jgi:WhiB family redox-sensing transcriptional regulator